VQTGLDVLEAEKFAPLRGKRIGLITNHTGLDSQGRSTVDVLSHAAGFQLIALFSPEHGLAGRNDEKVSSTKDLRLAFPFTVFMGRRGVPRRKCSRALMRWFSMFRTRACGSNTYTATMGYCMEEAAKRKIAFFVLDRPNLLGGEIVEGPVLDADKANFVAYFPLPVRYALTIGELAQFFNTENHIGADLHVITMRNWHRNYFLRKHRHQVDSALGRICAQSRDPSSIQGLKFSRARESPSDGVRKLRSRNWSAVDEWRRSGCGAKRAQSSRLAFLPAAIHSHCRTLQRTTLRRRVHKITDRFKVRSIRVGLEIAAILQKLYPKQFEISKMIELVGNSDTMQQLQSGVAPEKIVSSWADSLTAFDQVRRKYFLYK